MNTTLAFVAILRGTARAMLSALDKRLVDVVVVLAAYNRLGSLLGRDRADAILLDEAQRALHVTGERFSAVLSRGMSEAVKRSERPQAEAAAGSSEAVKRSDHPQHPQAPAPHTEADALANLKSSVFASLKREARSAGERSKPWQAFERVWREEMAALTDEQRKAVSDAWFEGLEARR